MSTMTDATIDRLQTVPFTAPKVRVGDIVFWYMDGVRGANPRPAIVTGIWHRSLNLAIISENMATFKVMDSVRHVDDPTSRIDEFSQAGAWDITPQHRELAVLMEAVLKKK